MFLQNKRWNLKESTSTSNATGIETEAHPGLYLFDVKHNSLCILSKAVLMACSQIRKRIFIFLKKKGGIEMLFITADIYFKCSLYLLTFSYNLHKRFQQFNLFAMES